MASHPDVQGFFDEATNTVSYVVSDPATKICAIVDSVLDYDQSAGRTSFKSADALIDHVRRHDLKLDWILETHVHADHLSAAPYIQDKLGGKLGIGDKIIVVQDTFGKIFNAGTEFQRDGSQFDHLFKDGDRFTIGSIEASVMHTPGHTPACLTYVIGDAAFIGDTLFMPDYGTRARTSPAVTRVSSTGRSRRYWLCHPRRDCSCAMTTKRRGAISSPGKRRSPLSAPAMSMSRTA